jgi:RNA polymerase sigma-70 factor (ECF subfamily)
VTTLTAERVPGVTSGAEAFASFYREVFGELAGYGWSLTGDPHVGDELAQEALTRVYARWGLLREPRPYAYRTVTNLARDRWKTQARETRGLAELIDERPVPAHDTTTLDAVRRLSPPLRDTVLLHYYADLPIEEVARVLRRPVGTVKRRLFDARAALAAALEETR